MLHPAAAHRAEQVRSRWSGGGIEACRHAASDLSCFRAVATVGGLSSSRVVPSVSATAPASEMRFPGQPEWSLLTTVVT
jgi:hypothetical protein